MAKHAQEDNSAADEDAQEQAAAYMIGYEDGVDADGLIPAVAPDLDTKDFVLVVGIGQVEPVAEFAAA